MTVPRFIFDAPVQTLRASDRVIRCPEPALAGATVLYVRSSRHAGHDGEPPVAFGPVSVITAPRDVDNIELEEPVSVGWGTRCIIERIPEPDEPYQVSAREPVTAPARLEIQVLSALTLDLAEYGIDSGEAGPVISELITETTVTQDAVLHGEPIDVRWYVDDHRVETPTEQSAREAADLFAGHTVRLHPAGWDAGETCPHCGRVVSWTDHLPPVSRGEFVRCTARVPRVAS